MAQLKHVLITLAVVFVGIYLANNVSVIRSAVGPASR